MEGWNRGERPVEAGNRGPGASFYRGNPIPRAQEYSRIHQLAGKDDTVANLQRKINLQLNNAVAILPIRAEDTTLEQVPKISTFPKSLFNWYEPSANKETARDNMDTVKQIMMVLGDDELELEDEVILELYLNLIVRLFPEIEREFRKYLLSYGFTFNTVTWDNRATELDIDLENYDDEDEYFSMSILVSVMGIYLILIGKQLNSRNYKGWMEGRIRSFTQSCGADASESVIERLVPSSTNCARIYSAISSKWEIRREIFKYVRAISSSKGSFAVMAKACMVLLHGAELGNFNLANKYIVIENPILLCWAELAKYSTHLIAAIDKYQSLGEDAPFCKLLYHSEALPEFNRQSLRIFSAIARQIAIHEGQTSFQNYNGTEEASTIKELCDRAMLLVKAAGGINTKITEDVRSHLLANTPDNRSILNDLGFGAHIDKKSYGQAIGVFEDKELGNLATL